MNITVVIIFLQFIIKELEDKNIGSEELYTSDFSVEGSPVKRACWIGTRIHDYRETVGADSVTTSWNNFREVFEAIVGAITDTAVEEIGDDFCWSGGVGYHVQNKVVLLF